MFDIIACCFFNYIFRGKGEFDKFRGGVGSRFYKKQQQGELLLIKGKKPIP